VDAVDGSGTKTVDIFETFCTMRIRLSRPELTGDMQEYLELCGCRPRAVAPAQIEASPRAEEADVALGRLELEGYLHVWRCRHAGVDVEVVATTTSSPPPQGVES
jgi:hypothetical protein